MMKEEREEEIMKSWGRRRATVLYSILWFLGYEKCGRRQRDGGEKAAWGLRDSRMIS